MDKINLSIPKKSEYMSTVRLATSALANIKSFNVDDIEDLKVIVSEVCTFFISSIKNSDRPLCIEYRVEKDRLTVEVADLNEGTIDEKDKANSEMCIMIIESLSDDYNFDLENKKIIFEKKLNFE
ncbi:MAG: ATP-binding protein [Sedimentibacter sp.]|uniref:ATP-binding protein n=1 Tax=Sedimentibacter sp. TaxID=1960295 RepID=UPI00315809A2